MAAERKGKENRGETKRGDERGDEWRRNVEREGNER